MKPSYLSRIGSGRLLRQLGLNGFFAAAAFLCVAGFLLLALLPSKRSFLVVAQTSIVDLAFESSTNTWNFPAATICRLKPVPDLRSQDGAGPCNAGVYEVNGTASFTIEWDAGAVVRMTVEGDQLVLTILSGQSDLPDRTRVVVRRSAFDAAGVLPFSARLTLGAPISAGQRQLLQGGRWEARETGIMTSLLRSNVTEVVKAGEIVRGSTLTVHEADGPTVMLGHVTSARADGDPYLEVVALSRPGAQNIEVAYFGMAEPTIIRPDLIDAALSSPLLLAFGILLSLLAAAVQIIKDLRGPQRE